MRSTRGVRGSGRGVTGGVTRGTTSGLLLLGLVLAGSNHCSSSSSGSGSDGGAASGSSSGSIGSSSGSAGSSSGGGGSGSGSGSSSGGSGSGATGSNSPVDTSGAVPSIAGCTVFPADNPWNTRIDDTTKFPVNAKWSTYQGTMNVAAHLHPDWGDWSADHYGIPWQTVPASQATVPMTFQYASESDPGPYPFPPSARIEGGANSGGDQHVLVVESGKCVLYETFASNLIGAGWSCGSGAKFDLTSNALRPDGWTSADAAGLPILPGLVKVSEVMAGAVKHAIRFTMNHTQQAYIHPAVHAAGKADATLPPMGLRLRLKAGFDTTPFKGPTLVILTALKQYGLILADNVSDWYFSGDSDDAWTPLMDAIVGDFSKVHGSDFEAVESGAVSTAGL